MDQYIHRLVECIPGVQATNPEFVWDDISEGSDKSTGIAFGFGRKKYVCLRNGLHDAFTKAENSERFNAVFLHELGHIENKDVDKTILSVALGKIFFSAALIMLFLFNAYFVVFFSKRLLTGDTLQPIYDAAPVFWSINVKGILIIFLVEIVRSSVLRTREYYADARARAWLGRPDGFFELFENKSAAKTSSLHKQTSKLGKDSKGFWHRQRNLFYDRLAPFHPTSRERIDALLSSQNLYRPSLELAFFAGLLSGLLTNSSFIITIGLNELWEQANNLNDLAQGVTTTSLFSLILLFVVAFAQLGLILVYIAAIIAFLVGFGVVSVAATVGIQVQAAAFVDGLTKLQTDYSRSSRLAIISLSLGVGFIIGCILVPIPKPFSLVGSSLSVILFFVLLWAFTFFVWLLPLVFASKRLYTRHLDVQDPKQKRRFITTLSALALVPTFIATSIIHVSLSLRIVSPEDVPIPNLTFWLISIYVLMLLFQAITWTIGWMIILNRGWLRLPVCPQCKASLPKEALSAFQCQACQAVVGQWALIPPALTMPVLPPPIEFSSAAPPL